MENFWQTLADAFRRTFFETTVYDYPNLLEAGWEDPRTPIWLILAGVFIGVMIASCAAVYNRGVLGKFIRALLRAEATDEGKAKTIAELGVKNVPGLRAALRSRMHPLRKTVKLAGLSEEDANDPKVTRDKIDFERARFYIPEERKYRAEFRFPSEGNTVRALVLTLCGTVVVYFAVLALLPYLYRVFDFAAGLAG